MLLRHARAASTPLVLVVVAAAIAALGVVATPAPAGAAPFVDTTNASYDTAVQALVDEDVIRGCTPDEFCPRDELTRAQMASLLTRALGLPASSSSPFTDTSGTHAANIDALAEAGITRGCTATAFCPDEPISRQQMASMLVRAFAPPATSTRFFDDISGAHGRNIDRLAAAGIAAGCQDPLTAFCPRDPVLRSQTALFLARAMDLVPRVNVSSLSERREQQAVIDAEREAERQREREAEQRRREADRDRIWEDLAQCESGGNWSINTGNGYYGGLQFALSSWRAVGGSGYPHHASRAEQIRRGERLLELQGWGAWPACSRRLGYR